jgi:hypothetical protein
MSIKAQLHPKHSGNSATEMSQRARRLGWGCKSKKGLSIRQAFEKTGK